MEITATQAEQLREKNSSVVFLDVREAEEVALCSISNSLHISLGELPNRYNHLPKDSPLVVYCHHGMRSMQAVQFLKNKGFDHAINLSGGIHAWSLAVDPSVPTY